MQQIKTESITDTVLIRSVDLIPSLVGLALESLFGELCRA
jgi:hypothetical protein